MRAWFKRLLSSVAGPRGTHDEARALRQRLLSTLRAQSAKHQRLLDQEDPDHDEISDLFDELEDLEERYQASLPRVTYGACPFDGLPLVRSFDPFGLDGPWWTPTGGALEPTPCPHARLVRGAVRFDGRPARGGAATVSPGPEVPYVLPRVLGLPGMVAVIGTLPMDHGLEAYVISYFSEHPIPPEELAADWKATSHAWTTDGGDNDFRVENDPWDFELAPWISRGKLRWVVPGTENGQLAPPGGPCPFVDLPGARRYQVVQGDHVSFLALPDGAAIDPFSP